MDFARFLQIYVIQGGFALFFLFMAYIVLNRGRKRINMYLSGFYLSSFIGGTINIIYANIFNEVIVYVLYFLTFYALCFSMTFLLVFVILILKPSHIINKKIQVLIFLIDGAFLLSLLLVPSGIVINESTNWKPDWNWIFLFILLIGWSSFVIFPTSHYSIKIYRKLGNSQLRKKWKFFLIGIFAYFFLFYGTIFSNTLNNDTFRLIWSFISLPTLLALYLIYYGVVRELN
ncbi:MAG: hypothetical protein ACFE8B_01400 [Candidatus Hermodarchaeota archaeon]